jgi:trk system potassium uptake protein TrkA
MGNPLREERILQPSPATVLRDEDVLVVIGKDEDINSLKEY